MDQLPPHYSINTQSGPGSGTAWYRVARLLGGVLIVLCLGYFVVELPGEYQDVNLGLEAARLSVAVGVSRRMVTLLLLAVQYTTLLVAGLTALLIYFKRVLPRGSNDWTALVASITLMLFILIPLGPPEMIYYPPSDTDLALIYSYVFMFYLMLLLLIYLMLIFPSGKFVPAWTRWLAMVMTVVWFGFGLFALATPRALWYVGITWAGMDRFALYIPETFLVVGFFFSMLYFLAIIAAVYSQAYRYRRVSTPLERQQTKWVVVSLALIPVYILYVIVNPFSGSTSIEISTFIDSIFRFLMALLIPLSIGISILRYRLWDIDVIIRRTLVYGALTATLAVVYLGSVVLLQGLFEALSGQRSAVAVVISTLVIAALFNPLRRRIQSDIDRRFFRRKYDAEKVVAAFSAELREEVDLEDLQNQILAVVEDTLQPEQVGLWLRKTERKEG
jgi:hypothetical protein